MLHQKIKFTTVDQVQRDASGGRTVALEGPEDFRSGRGDVGYIGSGDYCFANGLAMMLDHAGSRVDPGLIEVLTGIPFGAFLIEGETELEGYLSPIDVNPGDGIDRAAAALGWDHEVVVCGDEQEARLRVGEALASGPVLLGPLEIGHLQYNPLRHSVGIDHFAVAVDWNDDVVTMHDPGGYPWIEAPTDDVLAAWKANGVTYGAPFTLRHNFRPLTGLDEAPCADQAVERILPAALRSLLDPPAHRAGGDADERRWYNGPALRRLSILIATGQDRGWMRFGIRFALRLGARRMSDVARWLPERHQAAAELASQIARGYGRSHALAIRDDTRGVSAQLAVIGDLYDELASALATSLAQDSDQDREGDNP